MLQHGHHECAWGTSLSFTYGFSVRVSLLEVGEILGGFKVPIAVDNPMQSTKNKSLYANVRNVTHLHS